jgi:hypothetical protein
VLDTGPITSKTETALRKARETFAPYPPDEQPMLFYDYPYGRGFVLTDKAIYGCPNYIFRKPRCPRINIDDFHSIEFSDNKFTINNQYLSDLSPKDTNSVRERLILEDYFGRISGQVGCLTGQQLRLLCDPRIGSSFVSELAKRNASEMVLFKVIMSIQPREIIRFERDRLLITEYRIVLLPDKHQLRLHEDERFTVYSKVSNPTQIRHLPHLQNPVVKVGANIAKHLANEHAKKTHVPKVVEFTGFISPPKIDPIFPEYGLSGGYIEFKWRADEACEILSLAAAFEKLGIRREFGYARELND